MRPPVTRQILLDALLTGATATSVLEALIGPPVVVRRLLPALPPHTAAAAAQLRPLPGEVIQFRRVHLIAAGIDAAEGDLWYIPARLWPGMQDALTTTDTPFGAVIAPLGPRRLTLIARLCAADEPHGLEVAATVLSAQGQPIAYVEERFAASFPA